MKLFVLGLFVSIFSTTSCEPISDGESNYNDAVAKLQRFNATSLLEIENRLGMRKDEMLTILKQGQKEARSIKAAIDLFEENTKLLSEKNHISYLVDNVFIPGKIPHQFFCALAVYEDVLQHAYQRKGVNLYKPRFEEPVNQGKFGIYRTDPLFHTENLIEDLGRRAPDIDPEVIKSIAYDNLPPFRGPAAKVYHYHDSVLTNFIAWKLLLQEERLPLAKSVVAELERTYGDDWNNTISEFALVHARGWPLAGHIQHKLLREYVNFINRDPVGVTDFDSVLQKLMPSGWFFPVRHMEYVNLLFRAVQQCDNYAVQELDFEVFLLNKEYVIPQSTACSSSKRRNLTWYMTSSSSTPRSTTQSFEGYVPRRNTARKWNNEYD